MTCKDCLLRPMCFAVREIGEKDICAEHCPKFKNKADFVEVVRCKDCAIPHNRWTGCPKLNGLIPPPDFYCSYGKRK